MKSPQLIPSLAAAMTVALAAWIGSREVRAEPLRVCATTPDLGSLAQWIGAKRVAVSVFVKGPQDPHFLDPKPSFIKKLSRADVFIQCGAGLEIGWAPALLRSARNSKVRPGAPGFLDASRKIRRIYRPGIDRSAGDVHPEGNPHFLLDPLNALVVAEQLAERLAALWPAAKNDDLRRRFEAFRSRVAEKLLGKALLSKYDEADHPKLLRLLEKGGLDNFLKYLDDQDQRKLLGGWLGSLAPYRGSKVVADHDIWPYFARAFGIEVAGFLEPKPGITPTTKHLAKLISAMRAGGVRVILSAPYFDKRHADFIAAKTGGIVVEMAHQAGAREDTDGYLEMMDWNVTRLATALAEAEKKRKRPR